MTTTQEAATGWGRIALYDPAMASQVAEMFNAFNELWPGGFGGRVPYDAQRVHDWLDETSAIADLIALDADGEPVGYCGLYPHWRDANAAYVSVLGVVPRVKGHKYGRRMLLRAIEVACERGIDRVDLHTWSGNMNAVPLYKKVGLFWVPETSVYMQDYVPALLRMPFAEPWFARHPDWYACFQRELAQAPDRHVVAGMEVYEYVFEAGADRLTGRVDRYGWGLCGVARALDGERLAVETRLDAHEIQIGIPNALTIAIENGTDGDLPATLTVQGYAGLAWAEPFPLTVDVPAGASVTVTRGFVVDRSATLYKREASEVVRTRVILGREVIDLVTGGKIQPAAELVAHDAFHVAPPGVETSIYLDLFNNATEPLAGHVDVYAEGIPGSQRSVPFALEGKAVSGIVLPLHIPGVRPEPGAALQAGGEIHTVRATATIERDGARHAMPVVRLPVIADSAALATVVEGQDGDQIRVVTDQLQVTADLEGGALHLRRRSLPGPARHIELEIGPPYGLNLDRTLRYAWEAEPSDGALTVVLRAVSRQIPDLEIRKHIRVRPGAREVEHWTTVTSLQPSGTLSVGARVHVGSGGGLSLNPFGAPAQTYVPVDAHVLAADAILPVAAEHLLPQEAAAWRETWTAVKHLADGSFSAWFWEPRGVAKVRVDDGLLASLDVESTALQPGERVTLCHMWHGVGYVSLPEVRHRWSQLVGRVEIPFQEQQYGPRSVPPVDVGVVGDRVLYTGTSRRTLELRVATAYPLQGELRLSLPAGWGGGLVGPAGCVDALPMPRAAPGEPASLEVELSVPEREARAAATVDLCYEGEFEMRFPVTFLVAHPGAVRVERGELAGKPVTAVSNGALRFQVCGDVGGNLIRLEDSDGRTYLYDNYPEVKPRFFVDYHIGGVEPLVFCPGDESPFSELEDVTLEVVEEGEWGGVCASWTVRHHRSLRGQRFRVRYLVVPGCPVVRVRLEHENPVPRQVRWIGLVLVDLALGGDPDGTDICVPGSTQDWVRHRTPMPFVGPMHLHAPWSWVGKGACSLTAVVPEGVHGCAVPFDLGMMGTFLVADVTTEPEGRSVVEYALALNQPADSAMALRRALSYTEG
ncbi:MAG: GNAT family N-acetyltransferase [Anaerolineae bacterium]|nr:GNAT family N-acetyltransferase [Anaerolineae bacterium]